MGLSRNRCIDGPFGSTTEQTGMSWRPSIPECYMTNRFRLLPFVAYCMRPTKSLSGSTSWAFGRAMFFCCSTFMTPLRCSPRCWRRAVVDLQNPAPNDPPTWGHLSVGGELSQYVAVRFIGSRQSLLYNDTSRLGVGSSSGGASEVQWEGCRGTCLRGRKLPSIFGVLGLPSRTMITVHNELWDITFQSWQNAQHPFILSTPFRPTSARRYRAREAGRASLGSFQERSTALPLIGSLLTPGSVRHNVIRI